MSGRYVVGIDGSTPSNAALVWASLRAERDGKPLLLAHIDETHDLDDSERGVGGDLLRASVEQMRELHPSLQFSPALAHGSAVGELARLTRRDDVLVIGTHKTGYLNGRVLGSRSIQIAMATDCTVVVVPDSDLRFRSGVVAGIDRQETAAAVARVAAQEAESLGADLLLMHSSLTVPQDELLLATATQAAREQSPALSIRSRISDRPPVTALLDAARGKAVLVLGPGSLDRSRSPLRSVMHEVLLNANAPVLIARALEDARDDAADAADVAVEALPQPSH